MTRPFYFNMDGEPIDLETWADLFGDTEARILARQESPKIITAFFGHDLRLGLGDGSPHIFGTLLPDGEEWTYATREEALGGHERAVATYGPK